MKIIKTKIVEKSGLKTEYYKAGNKVVAYIEFPNEYGKIYQAVTCTSKHGGFSSLHLDYDEAKRVVLKFIDGIYAGNVKVE